MEWDDRYAAICPFASRMPYETWILPLNHACAFEEDVMSWEEQLHLARFLKSVLQRLENFTHDYHLVLHTTPNVKAKYDKRGHWQSLESDFHWHFEILPVVTMRSRSYSVKEVYYNSLLPEDAAEALRAATAAVAVPH